MLPAQEGQSALPNAETGTSEGWDLGVLASSRLPPRTEARPVRGTWLIHVLQWEGGPARCLPGMGLVVSGCTFPSISVPEGWGLGGLAISLT